MLGGLGGQCPLKLWLKEIAFLCGDAYFVLQRKIGLIICCDVFFYTFKANLGNFDIFVNIRIA